MLSTDLTQLVFFFLVIVPSAIFHEYAHGWMADRLGDPTPRQAGRLTFDPRAHIDPFGTILMPIILSLISGGAFLFAYAKPVPFNPMYLRNGSRGIALVGLAGPAANLVIAAVLGLLVRFLPAAGFTEFLAIIVYANVMLAVFNLVPLPPLDGSRLLNTLLGSRLPGLQLFLERYGFVLVIFFAFYAFHWLVPIIRWIFTYLTGLAG